MSSKTVNPVPRTLLITIRLIIDINTGMVTNANTVRNREKHVLNEHSRTSMNREKLLIKILIPVIGETKDVLKSSSLGSSMF